MAPTWESAAAILEDDELTELREARHRLDVESQAGCVKKSTRTSAQKLKRLPPAERRRICNELSMASARYGPVLADCLEAGALTGLRPCEWPSARILPGTGTGALALLVTNAKQGPHRAHGPTRTLTFEKLQDQKRGAQAMARDRRGLRCPNLQASPLTPQRSALKDHARALAPPEAAPNLVLRAARGRRDVQDRLPA